MKIYVTHSSDFDYKKELYLPIRNSNLNSKYEFILPHENNDHFNSYEVIKNADLILAEVSFPSTGQGIELGWANAFNKKILCINKTGSKISGSLKYISKDFLTYNDSELIDILSRNLE